MNSQLPEELHCMLELANYVLQIDLILAIIFMTAGVLMKPRNWNLIKLGAVIESLRQAPICSFSCSDTTDQPDRN